MLIAHLRAILVFIIALVETKTSQCIVANGTKFQVLYQVKINTVYVQAYQHLVI